MRRDHLKALAAVEELKLKDLSFKTVTRGEGNTVDLTVLHHSMKTGSLAEQIQLIRANPPLEGYRLESLKVYSSKDGKLALNIFTFAPHVSPFSTHVKMASPEDAKHILDSVSEIREGRHVGDPLMPTYDDKLMSEESLLEYISRCPPRYLQSCDPRRFLIHRELYSEVQGTDGSAVHIEKYRGEGGPPGGFTAAWITLAVGNAFPDELLALTADLLHVRGMDIWRAHMDNIMDPETDVDADLYSAAIPGKITMLRLLVSPNPIEKLDNNSIFGPEFLPKLKKDLKRCRWLDDSTLKLAYPKDPSQRAFGFAKAEVITALCSMMHGILSKSHPVAFASVNSIIDVITSLSYLCDITEKLAQLFLDKFNPSEDANVLSPESEAAFEKKLEVVEKQIAQLQYEEARLALSKMLLAIRLTLKTNVYNDDRFAMSLRIDPSLMFSEEELHETDEKKKKEIPFGAFFCHGRYFNGFHNRFRDIARGGLRLITPPNSEMKSADSSKLFDVVYGLSLGQQLKNKDIPEGGAKAVVLVDSPALDKQYHEVLQRKSVRCFVDSMLDLTVRDDLFRRTIVDRYGKEEVILLGPDVPADIDWIVKQYAKRGYSIPATIMSSKMEAGFNHKAFGVTSEGVAVFLDVALRESLCLDPKNQSFTIKITGGPDGDVAGNLLNILYREYGENCRVVGICDVDGVAEDPCGLDWQELLRLVREGKSVSYFDSNLLSSSGVCMRASDSEAAQGRRDSMPFRVIADAFVPAGGRPNTISTANFQEFLTPDGVPSSPIIVEGANVYIASDARELLFEFAKVMIVKDSSANKCGVITSSCEIACSMLLSTEEIMTNKNALFEDVLRHLRNTAKAEAKLLFSCFKKYPGTLPQFSGRISTCINNVTDALITRLDGLQPGDPLLEELLPLVKMNLPKKLAELAWDRAREKMPLQYQKNSIASTLGSLLVYREGIMLIERMPPEKHAESAISYYRALKETDELINRLEAEDTPSAEDYQLMLKLMKRGAARTAMDLDDLE